jgi:hypothetical protein
MTYCGLTFNYKRIIHVTVIEIIHQFLLGIGSIILAPANVLPLPDVRITLPPENASQAVGHDFARVSHDFKNAISKIEQANQLELELEGAPENNTR